MVPRPSIAPVDGNHLVLLVLVVVHLGRLGELSVPGGGGLFSRAGHSVGWVLYLLLLLRTASRSVIAEPGSYHHEDRGCCGDCYDGCEEEVICFFFLPVLSKLSCYKRFCLDITTTKESPLSVGLLVMF